MNDHAIAESLRQAGEALIKAAALMASKSVVAPIAPLSEAQRGDQMSAVCCQPDNVTVSPESRWPYEARQPWAVSLRAIVGMKLSANNWDQWKRLSLKFGWDILRPACERVPADKRWPDAVEVECQNMEKQAAQRAEYQRQKDALEERQKREAWIRQDKLANPEKYLWPKKDAG